MIGISMQMNFLKNEIYNKKVPGERRIKIEDKGPRNKMKNW